MAAIFQLRRGTSNVTLADGELYLHKGIGSIQFSSGSANAITLLPLGAPVSGNVILNGNITASNAYFTGDVAISGNLFLGNNTSDNISALGVFTSDIKPGTTNTYNIGTTTATWANVYANSISASAFTGSFSGSINGVEFTTFSTSVDSRLDQLETDSGSQNTRITGLESKATTLQTYTASINTRIDQLATDTGSQNTRIITLESKATTLQTYTASVDSRLSSLETDSGSQNTRITVLESKATTLQTYTASVDGHISDINSKTGSFESKFSTLETYTTSVNSRLNNVENYTASLLTAIDVTGGNTRIKGDLIVDGIQTSLNTTQLLIEDKVITLASGSTSSGAADGAGFEIAGANVSMSWQNANNRFEINTELAVTGYISASTFTGLNGVSLTSYSTSVDSRLTNLQSTSASVNGHITDINTKTGSFESKFTTIQSLTASYDIHTSSLNTFTQSVNGHISDLNSWTASQNQKDTIISSITASYNGFTGSATVSIVELFSTASNHEIRIDDLENKATTLQTYTASVDSRLSNLESDSGSQNTRITGLESKATTLQTYTASIDSKFVIIESLTASYNSVTASLNAFTASIYPTFSQSVDNRLDNVEYTVSILTPEGQAEAFNAINNFTSSANNRLNNLELTSASLNLWSSSLNTTFATDSELTAVSTSISTSIQSLSQSLDIRLDQLESDSGSQNTRITTLENKATTLQTYTASVDGHISDINTKTGSFESKFSTLGTYTASVNGHISDINSYTSSNDTTNTTQNNRLTRIEESTASLNTFTASADSRLDVIETTYATTGSNTFYGTQVITGSTYISGDLIVQGSSSLQNISASAVDIGTNIIFLNTDTPAIRFGGISVFDSGSTAGTGSLLWDSENERWIYQKASGSSYSGGMLISGPRNTGSLGEEVGMPTNKLIMGIGGDHISSSNIYHNGTDTAFAGNVEVTGSTTLGTANITTLNAGNGVISGSTQLSGKIIPNLSGSFTGSYTGSFTGSFKGTLSGLADYALYPLVTNSGPTTDTSLFPIFTSNANVNQYATLLSHPSSSFFFNGVTRHLNAEGFVGAIYATNGVVSGSSQIDATATTNWSTGIKTQLDSNTVVSGSSQITLSSTTGGGTTANVQFGSLGIGTTASGVSGEIRATGDIVAFYSSDERLKENIQPIQNALSKVESISGNTYDWKEGFETIHSHIGHDLGVIAQEVQSVLPEVVTERETGYLAVDYVKLVPVLIEAIKELSAKVKELESK